MHRAVHALIKSHGLPPYHLVIDGNYFVPYPGITHETIVQGDAKVDAISAASILAKVHRDRYICDLIKENPLLDLHYGLGKNKGYGTKTHMEGIHKYGRHDNHRQTFKIKNAV